MIKRKVMVDDRFCELGIIEGGESERDLFDFSNPLVKGYIIIIKKLTARRN